MKPPAPGSAEIVAARHAAILDVARRTGSVGVDELAEKLGVTPQTIRKDLNILAGQSMLARVHGGAVVTSGTDNLAYAERRSVAAPAKAAIGSAAAALVPNGKLAIEQGELKSLGQLMDINHMSLAGLMLVNSQVQDMVGAARAAGALGAKMTGAGGGGCMIALVDEQSRSKVLAALAAYQPFEAWIR